MPKLSESQKERIGEIMLTYAREYRESETWSPIENQKRLNRIVAIVEEEPNCDHSQDESFYCTKCGKSRGIDFTPDGPRKQKPRRIGLLPEVFAGLHPDVAMLWKAVRELQKDRNERLGV